MIEASEYIEEALNDVKICTEKEKKRKSRKDYYHRHVKELCPEQKKIFYGNVNPEKRIKYRRKMKEMSEEEKNKRNKERAERTRKSRKQKNEEMKQNMMEEEKVIRRSKFAFHRQNSHLKLAKNQSNPATATATATAVILNRGINAQIGNVVSLDGSVNVNLHLNNIIRANCDMSVNINDIVVSKDNVDVTILNGTGLDCDMDVTIVNMVDSEGLGDMEYNIIRADCDTSVNINDIVVSKDNLDCDMDVTIMDMVSSEGDVDVTDSSVDAMNVVDTCCYEDGHDRSIADPLADEDANLSYKPSFMYAQGLQITDDVISAAQQLLKLQHCNSSPFGSICNSFNDTNILVSTRYSSDTSIRSRDHPSDTSIRSRDHPSDTSIRSRDHSSGTSIRSRDHPSGTSIRSRDHPSGTSIDDERFYTIYQLCGANEEGDTYYRNDNISPLVQRLSNVFNDSNSSKVSNEHPSDTSIPIREEGRYTIYQLCGANEEVDYRKGNISPLAQRLSYCLNNKNGNISPLAQRLSNYFNDSNDSDSY